MPDDNAFGSWISKNNNTVYQAASDGFVCSYRNTHGEIKGYTDSSNPPTTVRLAWEPGYGYEVGLMMPVKKNDYWKVTGADTVYWLPIGA